MPNRSPSRRTRRPVSSAASLALPPARSTGIVPTPRMKPAVRRPLTPVPVK
ncbi:Uncharacterised protein [Mycobacteroides abscessus]|nr:Uncharacterised protein [Mycobacteroides abscessus]